jgi:hypothetical protein
MASRGELALAVGTVTMAAGAFLGHAVVPDQIANRYGWPHQRWYQREIGAFNAGLGYGVIAYARGRCQEVSVESWAVSAVLLAVTRTAVLISGERMAALSIPGRLRAGGCRAGPGAPEFPQVWTWSSRGTARTPSTLRPALDQGLPADVLGRQLSVPVLVGTRLRHPTPRGLFRRTGRLDREVDS